PAHRALFRPLYEVITMANARPEDDAPTAEEAGADVTADTETVSDLAADAEGAAAEGPPESAAEGDAKEAAGDPAAENAKLKDQLLRTLAELENTRKRAEREREQTRKFGIADFARDLLSASDNLRRALEAAPENRDGLDDNLRNLVIGVEMTEKDLLAAFDKHGIRKIDPLGEAFDYNFHQAMFEVENADYAAGTVMQVLQAGYAIGDRLLRPAMVGVSKGASGSVDTSA
ncbi:MAG: nucleotide exchange factor GrpE, partial [Pseudomonadota bacterium]|nr:nucleotide exchange factor GrpE [Pseudomonadota bacterium]